MADGAEKTVADARVRVHEEYGAGYRLLVLEAPAISRSVIPGQFVHVRIPDYEIAVLRRPFSVFGAKGDTLSVLYKTVGSGTRALTRLEPGAAISVLGPLGNGFPRPDDGAHPALVAGGYGVAPLCFLAHRAAPRTGTAFVGARTAADVLCADVLRALGWDVRVATEDGSLGLTGRVTDAIDVWLEERETDGVTTAPEYFACGPDGMLRAVGERAIGKGCRAWLSLDKHMGCGIGACLACVQKVRREDGGVEWTRVCKEGPVFEARRIVWE